MQFSSKEKQRLLKKYGPWALVTGASSGIGKEIAKNLADAGFNLIINSRSQSTLIEFQEELNRLGVQTKVVASDLSTEEGIEALIEAAKPFDIGLFIASAGFGTSGSFLNTSLHAEVNMLKVNCEALLKLTHHFANIFASKKRGGIILLSSMVAFQGVPFSANYAATKAYVQSLAEALSRELKSIGVDVLSAAPGPVASGFGQRANMQMNMTLTPQQVGVPILKALGRKTTVLPGRLTKALVYSLNTLPRWGKVRVMQLVMGGMTQHQRI